MWCFDINMIVQWNGSELLTAATTADLFFDSDTDLKCGNVEYPLTKVLTSEESDA